jgi:hypothetical protein
MAGVMKVMFPVRSMIEVMSDERTNNERIRCS